MGKAAIHCDNHPAYLERLGPDIGIGNEMAFFRRLRIASWGNKLFGYYSARIMKAVILNLSSISALISGVFSFTFRFVCYVTESTAWMPVRPKLQLNTTEKLAVTIPSFLMFLVFGVLCFFSDRRPPSQHLPIVALSDISIVLAGYEIGRPLIVPECPFSKKESGATYDYTLRTTCFERLSAGEIGTRVDRPEWIQVEQLDIAKQYDDLDWKQPICVGLVAAKSKPPSQKRDKESPLRNDNGFLTATRVPCGRRMEIVQISLPELRKSYVDRGAAFRDLSSIID